MTRQAVICPLRLFPAHSLCLLLLLHQQCGQTIKRCERRSRLTEWEMFSYIAAHTTCQTLGLTRCSTGLAECSRSSNRISQESRVFSQKALRCVRMTSAG